MRDLLSYLDNLFVKANSLKNVSHQTTKRSLLDYRAGSFGTSGPILRKVLDRK